MDTRLAASGIVPWVRAALGVWEPRAASDAQATLPTLDGVGVAALLELLAAHRLQPIAHLNLARFAEGREAPAELRRALERAHFECFVRNGVRMAALDRVLAELADRGVKPVLLKGAALVNSVYPTLGSRPFEDVDLLVLERESAVVEQTLRALGYELAQSDADTRTYRGASGDLIDVHHHMRIFDGLEPAELVIELEPRFLATASVSILEPVAWIVHLIAHLEGHSGETGYLLSWLHDLALVVRHPGTEIPRERLARLARSSGTEYALARVSGLLEEEWRVEPLFHSAHRALPLTFEEVLRSRRVGAWKSGGLRARLRMAAEWLRPTRARARSTPSWRELRAWSSDRRRNARARRAFDEDAKALRPERLGPASGEVPADSD